MAHVRQPRDYVVIESQEEGAAPTARQIDDKLKATHDAHDTKVDLIEFEMKIGAMAV
jgi:hypothetical protein